MVEEFNNKKDPEKRPAPVSEGFTILRNLLVTSNTGHIETILNEKPTILCVGDYYCSNGDPSTDFPPTAEWVHNDLAVLIGKNGSCLAELLRPEYSDYPLALLESYQITANGVDFYSTRGEVIARSILGFNIQVNSKNPDMGPNWDMENFTIVDPERRHGLALALANRITASLK